MPYGQVSDDTAMCSDLIFIPPELPDILKLYCKAAIRTQPYDLLRWSAVYFRACASGHIPPVKERLEFPATESPPALTLGYIKILLNQLGKDPDFLISSRKIAHKWEELSLPQAQLDRLLTLMNGRKFLWLRFIAVATASLSTSLTNTMSTICELLTNEPEDGPSCISLETFMSLYEFLAFLDCGPVIQDVEEAHPNEKLGEFDEINSNWVHPKSDSLIGEDDAVIEDVMKGEDDILLGEDNEDLGKVSEFFHGEHVNALHFPGIGSVLPKDQVDKVRAFLEFWAEKQQGMVMPRNLRHCKCPSLDPITPMTPYPCNRRGD